MGHRGTFFDMRAAWGVGAVALGALLPCGCSDADGPAEAAACENGQLDSGEENTDCGGACPACQSQVAQYGITWSFDQGYRVGQFANGDYWVLGPATVTSISPDFDGSHHGWEVNPEYSTSEQGQFNGDQGFDDRIPFFDPSLVPPLPYAAAADQSIVKAISYLEGTEGDCADGFDHWCLSTAAVLTVVGSVPPDDGATVFRPPYVGARKPLYSIHNLQTEALPSLARLPNAPTLAWVAERFQRLQMDHEPGNTGRCIRPIENFHPPHRYGPSIGIENSEAILALMFDDPMDEKMPAIIRYAQTGIDWIFAVEQGKSWTVGGPGIQPGFKAPTVFAATLLGDAALQEIVRSAEFPERYYLKPHADMAGRALFGTEPPWWSERDYWEYIVAKDNGEDVSTSSARDPYFYIDGELPEIGYAVHIFPTPWKGAVLSALLMPAMEPVWNNPLIFDYIDRHVNVGRWTQPDPCAPHDGNMDNYGVTFGPDGQGGCILDADPSDGTGRYPDLHGQYADEPIDGGYTSDFISAMWTAYHPG